ncbi:MAG TPA: homoserine kinase [Candidatus Polarisedimenticolia bacterium]|nr:homoserine kinase [Candidatus Polarisedimenticolia bacterium]
MTEPHAQPSLVKVFAPASIANLGPGFDSLGVALEGLGDTVEARRTETPGVRIVEMTGERESIPTDPAKNCAGRAAESVLKQLKGKAAREAGLEMRLHKGLPMGSGLGSSAASAVAGAVAAHLLFGSALGSNMLLEAALEGEVLASGGRHADNLAASLLGGFTIVRSHQPLDVIRLEMPSAFRFVIVLPGMEIETRYARSVLPETIPLKDAAVNWANTAALVAAVAQGKVGDFGRAVVDRVVEPVRSVLIPGFADVKRAAFEAGAHGCSISGAGPAMFAVAAAEAAEKVALAMHAAFQRHGLAGRHFICAPDNRGARRLD